MIFHVLFDREERTFVAYFHTSFDIEVSGSMKTAGIKDSLIITSLLKEIKNHIISDNEIGSGLYCCSVCLLDNLTKSCNSLLRVEKVIYDTPNSSNYMRLKMTDNGFYFTIKKKIEEVQKYSNLVKIFPFCTSHKKSLLYVEEHSQLCVVALDKTKLNVTSISMEEENYVVTYQNTNHSKMYLIELSNIYEVWTIH